MTNTQTNPSTSERNYDFCMTLSRLIGSCQTQPLYTRTVKSFVMNNLKYSTLHKFSSPITKSRFHNSGLEGFHTSDILVNVKCDLSTFVEAVTSLQNNEKAVIDLDFSFSPGLSSFENPSRATKSLSVEFRNLQQLLLWLDIKDPRDNLVIGHRLSNTQSSGTLRLLGSSFVLKACQFGPSQKSVDVDIVLPFTSSTMSTYQAIVKALKDTELQTSCSYAPALQSDFNNQHVIDCNDGCRETVVYYRKRENYDETQGRYLSPWRTSIIRSPFFSEFNECIDDTRFTDSTFTVQWTSAPPLSNKLWTSDATFFGTSVMGEVTIFFPSVTFFGSSTVIELIALTDALLPHQE